MKKPTSADLPGLELASQIWSEKGSKQACQEFNLHLADALSSAKAALERETRISAPVDYLASEQQAPAVDPVDLLVPPRDYVHTPRMQKWLDSPWSLPFKYFKRFCNSEIVKSLMSMYPHLPAPFRVAIIILQGGIILSAIWTLCFSGFFK